MQQAARLIAAAMALPPHCGAWDLYQRITRSPPGPKSFGASSRMSWLHAMKAPSSPSLSARTGLVSPSYRHQRFRCLRVCTTISEHGRELHPARLRTWRREAAESSSAVSEQSCLPRPLQFPEASLPKEREIGSLLELHRAAAGAGVYHAAIPRSPQRPGPGHLGGP